VRGAARLGLILLGAALFALAALLLFTAID
jgi:hypothetical protein